MMKKTLILISFAIANTANAQNLHRFYEDSKVGYQTDNKEIIVKPIYQAGSEMIDGYALVVYNGKRGFIDKTGNEVINLLYDDATMFSQEGLAAAKFAGKYGYINKKGQWVIQPIFENAYGFSNGLARVVKNNLSGFINTNGVLVIPFQYEIANDFSENVCCVKQKNKFGFIDKTGAVVLDFKYLMATSFKNAKAIVVDALDKDLEKIYINHNGKKVGEVPKLKEEEEREEHNKRKN